MSALRSPSVLATIGGYVINHTEANLFQRDMNWNIAGSSLSGGKRVYLMKSPFKLNPFIVLLWILYIKLFIVLSIKLK